MEAETAPPAQTTTPEANADPAEVVDTSPTNPVEAASTNPLAQIVRVIELQPIANADRIEMATALGWNCVVQKAEFEPGSLAVYVAIDTLVDPTRDVFQKFADPKNPTKLIRIATKKLRGVYSQGLLLPITAVPEEFRTEGTEVAELLGVLKYEKVNTIDEAFVTGSGGTFPTHLISKTNEIHLKNNKQLLEGAMGHPCYATMKMDGCSMTVVRSGNEVLVCSRSQTCLSEDSQYIKMAEKLNLFEQLKALPYALAIQGELCGPKINCNVLNLKDYDFFVFNMRNVETKKRLGLTEMQEMCAQLGLKMVPVLSQFTMEETMNVPYWQQFSNCQKYPNRVAAEGIVVRTCVPMHHEGNFLSFKVINQNYVD